MSCTIQSQKSMRILFPLFGGRVLIKLCEFSLEIQDFFKFKPKKQRYVLVITTKVHWTYSLRLHGHNRLQSVMTEAHGGNGGTKVVDQLLIDISTGDSSVVGSQSSARDNIQTKNSGKSVSRKKSTTETTAKTTTN